MIVPRWLTARQVANFHSEQLAIHGGPAGIRDEGALESAVARPLHKFTYENEQDLAVLAAAYAFGIAKNHPFVDGNKRASLLALVVFLRKNGIAFQVPEAEAAAAILSLAAGEIDEMILAQWIRDNWPDVDKD